VDIIMKRSMSRIPICILMLLSLAGCLSSTSNQEATKEPTPSPSDVPPAIPTLPTRLELAPPFETIEEQMAQLVAQAKCSDCEWFGETFSRSKAYFDYQQSIRGKVAFGWAGWVIGIWEFDPSLSDSTVEVVMTNPESYQGGTADAFLNGAPLAELEKLRRWQQLAQFGHPWDQWDIPATPTPPQLIVFSGTITAVQWVGLVSLTDVTLEPKN
jgi:hypothetical protein